MPAVALMVPVRSFASGKSRLAHRLEPDQRARLARALAEVVVDVAHGLPTYVVCDVHEIADWATDRGARAVIVAARGLNESLTEARPHVLESTSADWIAIVHADLPLATSLGVELGRLLSGRSDDSVVIVTDRAGDGTNVLLIHRRELARWTFAYGPASCTAHLDQAVSLGLRPEIVESVDLSVDLDTEADLDDPRVMTFVETVRAQGSRR